MKAIHLKANIQPDGTVLLPSESGPWKPGPIELIILQPEVSTSGLMEFAGMLSDEEAAAIRKAVAEGCESVDSDGEYCLDTNIVVAFLNGRPEVLQQIAQAKRIVLPAPVVGELLYGRSSN